MPFKTLFGYSTCWLIEYRCYLRKLLVNKPTLISPDISTGERTHPRRGGAADWCNMPKQSKCSQAFGSGQVESGSKRYAAQPIDLEEDTTVDLSNLE